MSTAPPTIAISGAIAAAIIASVFPLRSRARLAITPGAGKGEVATVTTTAYASHRAGFLSVDG